MTARADLAMVKHVEAGAAVSYGRTWTAAHATSARPRAGRVRRRAAARRRQPRRGRGGRAASPDPRPDLHGPARRRPRRRRPRRRRRRRGLRARHPRRADRAGLGRGVRDDQLRDRHPDRRPVPPPARRQREDRTRDRPRPDPRCRRGSRSASRPQARRSASAASAGSIDRRKVDETPFGALRSRPVTVVADDGVPLHVEVDELDPGLRQPASPLTLVFCHGYALNLDCWHFQRAAYRGLVRAVYYDQRSHGRSGRSDRGPRHHRPARPRPRGGARRGRPRRPGGARGPLHGRHGDRRPHRAAHRADRRPRRRRRPDLDHGRRPRPAAGSCSRCCPPSSAAS